jgi:hypothetical protein
MKRNSKNDTFEELTERLEMIRAIELGSKNTNELVIIESQLEDLKSEFRVHFRQLSLMLFLPSYKLSKKPQLQKLSLVADNLPVSWGKIVKASAADYEERINELWGAGKYRSAKWNQKLAWICALSNLGYYLWLKAWKPVSTVFRRLL